MQSSLRHTLHTRQDVEHLSDYWSFSAESFELSKFDGIYEARLKTPLEAETLELLHGVRSVQISYRTPNTDLGDLFYSELFDGLTILLWHHDRKEGEATTFQGYKMLELMTHQRLESALGRRALFDVSGVELLYNMTADADTLRQHLAARIPSLASLVQAASFLQISMDSDSQSLTLRTIRSINPSETLHIPTQCETFPGLRSEIGLVQRQRRNLPDSEFRGLSAFLDPAFSADKEADLTPFTIFFDQRVQPDAKAAMRHRTEMIGAGSHLTLKTNWIDPQAAHTHLAQLEQADCSLHALYMLPKTYFFDVFELQTRWPNQWRQYGEGDLEAPEWQTAGWGSLGLLDITSTGDAGMDVPIHARYMAANDGGRPEQVVMPAPKLLSSCPMMDATFEDSPFDTPTLLTTLLGDGQQFRFFQDVGPSSLEAQIAVADAAAVNQVMVGTLGTVLLGTLYIVRCCFRRPRDAIKKKTL